MFQPPVRVAGGIFLLLFGVLRCEGAVQYDVGLPGDIFENVLTHGEIWRIIRRVLRTRCISVSNAGVAGGFIVCWRVRTALW